jgi:hypothetical protein
MPFCHSLPRDNVLRLGVAIIMLALLLASCSVGIGGREEFADIKHNGVVIAKLDRTSIIDATTGLALCERATTSNVYCSQYLDWVDKTGVFMISLCAMTMVAFLVVWCCISPYVKVSVDLIFAFVLAMVFPTGMACGVLACYVRGVEGNAKRFAADFKGTSSDSFTVVGGRAINLGYVAVAFYIISTVLVCGRSILLCMTNKANKEARFREGNIEAVVQGRVANDDLQRQHDMMEAHADAVRRDFAESEPVSA